MNLKIKNTNPHKCIGIAADHGGFELKQYLSERLTEAGYEIKDYGNTIYNSTDDYPDFIFPLANAVSEGDVERGIAICGSGVGAAIAANKVKDVRACLIHDTFSAHQGVEDDNMNIICLGGRVIGKDYAWELITTFLSAEFSGAERHILRLEKIRAMENNKTEFLE